MSIVIETATPDDLATLTTLINDSYEVETGNTGVAFKKMKRIVSPEQNLLPDIMAQRTLKAMIDNEIVGCVVWEIIQDHPSSNNGTTITTAIPPVSSDSFVTPNPDDSLPTIDTPPTPPNGGVKRLHFGPFAVNPKLQGKGIGKALLNYLYSMAKTNHCTSVDIEVVQLRTDILPMYEVMGYERIGEAPFPVPEYTTRDCYFIRLRKML